MSVEVFPIRSRRLDRVRRVQTLQHLLGAMILIVTAWGHLTDPKHHDTIDIVLPLLEIAAGAALIITAIVEKVRKTHPRVAWLELAGAAMMYVEAFAKLRDRHHLSFYILSFISPTILLLFALFDARIKAGLRLEANDDGFFARLRMIRAHRIPWTDIRSYRITPKHLELTRGNGRVKRLKLTDVYERDAANAWLEEQFTKRGFAAGLGTPPPSSAG